MEYRIVEKPAFTVVGKSLRVGTKDGENMRRIPQFWQESRQDGTIAEVAGIAEKGTVVGNVTLGICMDFAADMSEFTYWIAAEGSSEDAGSTLTETTIPAATWAAFESRGAMPDAIQAVWGKIWSEFFPTAPYTHGPGPDLELYPPGNTRADDYVCEVWIPVVAK